MNFDYVRSCRSVDSLFSFIKDYFKYSWNLHQLKDHLNAAESFNYFCYNESYLIGYIFFNFNKLTNQAHLYQICVHPSFRERQVAQELLRRSVESMPKDLESIYLEVEVENEAAIKFYEKFGFNKLNKINSFYSDGSDAYAMHLDSSELARLH